jgi:hypothetical protein
VTQIKLHRFHHLGVAGDCDSESPHEITWDVKLASKYIMIGLCSRP